ncbi:MAG: efflux RND transporter periplasmic adaptor subunit [Isosphaeraceae bacterium]
MTLKKTALAMAGGLLATLSMAVFAQNAQDPPSAANPRVATLVLDELASVGFIEKSQVAALREGVIEKIELEEGALALKDHPIGFLHRKSAELAVAKAKIQADAVGAIEKGKAARYVALQTVARNKRLNDRRPGMVSAEDVAKAEGELRVAEAQTKEAEEQQAVAQAELAIAQQAFDEHTIKSPFDGIVLKVMKHPGESVRANEAVAEVGNLSRLCARAWVPVRYALKVKEGQVVEIRPRVDSEVVGKEEIESMTFRGKITFVDPQVQAVNELSRRISAEFQNTDFKLIPGLKVQMTIFLTNDIASRVPPPATR